MKKVLSILGICIIAAAASLTMGCKEECCGDDASKCCGKEAAAACTQCEGECKCAPEQAACTKCEGECKCAKE